VGKATKQPVVNEAYDSISVGYVMHVCLTADHRVVDGADAARFMNRLKHLLEHPTYLLAL
jgi:pyruvate/2-oxoglutarate dehydrogenase complex dihydrolipoamide acyltransferase (E2) component